LKVAWGAGLVVAMSMQVLAIATLSRATGNKKSPPYFAVWRAFVCFFRSDYAVIEAGRLPA